MELGDGEDVFGVHDDEIEEGFCTYKAESVLGHDVEILEEL